MTRPSQNNSKEQKYRTWAALLSVSVGALLMVFKFWAYNLTQSQAVYSDAMESIVNVVAAGLALFVVIYGAKAPDKDHPYGHGKVEYFSAAFEGGLIAFAAVLILIASVQAYLKGLPLKELNAGMWIVAGAGVGNLLLGLVLIQVGKKNNSVALRASGHHVISDFWTSVGVVVGLLLVKFTGYIWLDSFFAFIVGLYLAYTGFKLVKHSVGGLMDEEDLDVLQELAIVFAKYARPGFIQFHHVKVIRSGDFHHIDAHIVIPEFWNVERVHDEIFAFEKVVIDGYKHNGEMNFHVDPCRRAYCQACDLKTCEIRQNDFKQKIPIVLDHLRSPDEPEEYRDESYLKNNPGGV